ncbi:DUF397 domain-containing protein [Streptomyces sp. NBC_00019]|uniref:DUF397 domain-containing protein n=1 Tax=Streptomyces sp. NBC_00019 TaxID=2975623 RepID=UPI0032437528
MSDTALQWFKSSYSGDEGGACVEIATQPTAVHVRDSKNPSGPQLAVAPDAWAAFVAQR